MQTLQQLWDAITQGEGANVPGSIPNVTGNSGDLELGDIGYGLVSAQGGQQITSFGGDTNLANSEGENLLSTEIYNEQNGLSPGLTMDQYLNQYATGSTTGTNTLAGNVSKLLGLPGTTPLTSFGQVASQATASAPVTGSVPFAVPSIPIVGTPFSIPGTSGVVSADVANKIANGGPSGWIAGIEAYIGNEESGWVAIAVGLVLIAGAVFGFRTLSDAAIGVTKIAAKKGIEVATA